MPEPPEPTALYRLYDEHDRLLYIGITKHPPTRWRQHALDKADSWWPDVTRKAVEWHASRPEAEQAEALAIRTEGPPYNDRHSVNWVEPGCRRPASIPSERARRQRWDLIEKSAAVNQESRKTKTSFPDLIARTLRDRIRSGAYPVGSKLPIGWTLARELGVSPPTLSKAITQLKSEGIVEVRRGHGTFVTAVPGSADDGHP